MKKFSQNWFRLCLIGLVLAIGFMTGAEVLAKEIKVGGLFDMTGPTSEVGADYGLGAMAAAKYINQNGGIMGQKIKLIPNDYAYRIPDAVNLYKRYRSLDKVFIVQGWGTGDTNALRGLVNRHKCVFMSASYDGGLADPKKTPYNFYIGTPYGETIRMALDFAKANGAKKFVFIYPDHPYGKNPIPAGKEYAKEIGLEVGPDEIVPLKAIDATSQLLHLKDYNPDFAWIGNTTASAAVILKDAAKLGLKTKFLINCYGFDRNLPRLAGGAAQGRAFGMMPVVPMGADVPGMKAVLEAAEGKTYTYNFVKSWVSMLVMAEGLKRAKKAGNLSGPGLKDALETLKDFDTGGLTAPITFTPKDHRPNTALSIYTVGENGDLVKVKDAKFPRLDKYLGY
jgi:branched-chain amino acid transport system substrate-binding protein